jgi:hypothetical protein
MAPTTAPPTTTPPTTPPPTTAPPTTIPPASTADAEIAAIIAGAVQEASAEDQIVSHDCGGLEDGAITCSVQLASGYGMYLVIYVAPGGNYSWELMGGM